jgi:hypothetical protein
MAGPERRPYDPRLRRIPDAGVLMRVVTIEFPDRASARLAVHAIRPVLTAAAGPWWFEQRGEGWRIGGRVPVEWEDFVADTVAALGGCEVVAGAAARLDDLLARC